MYKKKLNKYINKQKIYINILYFIMSKAKKNYYRILGVFKDTEASQIKKAYHKLALKWHPDKNPNNREECEEKFKEISEAYGILSDPDKKKQYDDDDDDDIYDEDDDGVYDEDDDVYDEDYDKDDDGVYDEDNDVYDEDYDKDDDGVYDEDDDVYDEDDEVVYDEDDSNFSNKFYNSSKMFGNRFSKGNMDTSRYREKLKTTQYVIVKLKLAEIFFGIKKSIDISIDDICSGCDGTSIIKFTCTKCNGRGVHVAFRRMDPYGNILTERKEPCSDCYKGNIIEVCFICSGKCTISAKLNKVLNITKNFDYKSVMLIKNSGNYDPDTQLKADINISFKISDLDKYNLELKNTYDLVLNYPIDISDAFTGYSIYWDKHPEYPHGIYYCFKINKINEINDIKFIGNFGLPNDDNQKNNRGKLYINFSYIYPTSILDKDSLKLLIKNKDGGAMYNLGNYCYDIKNYTEMILSLYTFYKIKCI